MADNFFRPWTINEKTRNVAENNTEEEDCDSILSLPIEDNNIRSPYEGSDERRSNESLSSPINVENVGEEQSLDSVPRNSYEASSKDNARLSTDQCPNDINTGTKNLPSTSNANFLAYCQFDYLHNINLYQPSEMFTIQNMNGTCWPSSSFLNINAFTNACRTAIPPPIHHYTPPTYTTSVEKAAEPLQAIKQVSKQASKCIKLRPKKFCYEYCDVVFNNNTKLKRHIGIHNVGKRYKCDSEECSKNFTWNEELTLWYKRIHTG
ncbi:zinc finger protein 184-like [Vespula maculifrons]|uniref:Zinc finger protein 184-like n=1 Tax=Vespula maculifrons TaxID=7453 RepID=A0ABD2BB37_VESMC